MSETNARTPGVPIKPPDAAHRLEAWLGRADEPRLELVGPGDYNELLQDAQRSWATVERSVKEPGARASENQEVEERLQELARDRYFLTLTESNIETLLALLSKASADGAGGLPASNGIRAACRVLAAWVRRTSVQPGPSWASKQVSAIVNAACPSLTSAASEEAAGSIIYLLGSAAAAPHCVPADRSRCQDVIIRGLQQKRSAIIEGSQFLDALTGAAYLITGGPGVHGPPLAALLTTLLNLWSAPPESPSSATPSNFYTSALPRQKRASNGPSLQSQTPTSALNSPSLTSPSVALPTQQPQSHSDSPNLSFHRPQPPKPQPPLGQALALSRLLEYVGAQARARARSQDFGTRALGLADAKAIQASLAEALSAAQGSGTPASCAAVLALAGFYRGLGVRRGEGFKGAAEDWQRLVGRQEGLLLEAARGALSAPSEPPMSYARGFGNSGQNAGGYGKWNRSHWLYCIALACARCELASGSPLAGHEAVLACLRKAVFDHLLSLAQLHRAVGSFLVPRGSSKTKWNGSGTERSGEAGLAARLPRYSAPEVVGSSVGIPFSTMHMDLVAAVDELRERVEGEAFRNVGVLARALCDHCREAGHANRRGVMREVLRFAQNLGDGHRVYAASAARAYGELERGATEAAEAAVRKVLDAAFLSVTVFCGTLLPEGAVPAGSAPPTEPELGGLAVYCLEALSRVEFCRVPFAEYGSLVTRAVSAASGSREWAEGLARRMPPYEETTEFLWKAATEGALPEHSQQGLSGLVTCAEETRVPERESLSERSGGGETRGKTVESAASTSGRSQADVTSETFPQDQAFERALIHTGPGGLPPEVSRSTSWALDAVHSAQVHFMLRVLAPCVEKLGDDVFADVVIPTLLLFLLHPAAAVSRSAHVLFSAFLESREAFRQMDRNERTEWGAGTERSAYEEWADQDLGPVQAAPKTGLFPKVGFLQRLSFAPPQTDVRTSSPPETSVPERVALFYVERSLLGFPGLTSFEAFTGGVASIVRHVPPGSPAIVLALRRIASAAKSLYERNVPYVVPEGERKEAKEGGQPEESAGGQLIRLLVHLIPVVDIQVLTGLLQETEAVVLSIQDQTAQQAALAELYEVLAANEDYTRKAHCTVWYQHLAEKCVKQFRARLKEGTAGAATAATAKSKSGKGGGRAWSGLWGLARARPNVGGGSAGAVT